MNKTSKIAVIGGGSWATAIVKMLSENIDTVNWWMRNKDTITHIQQFGHNPNYISSAELKKEKIILSSNINNIVELADCLVLAVPSVFLKETLQKITVSIKDKLIISAIKGIVPENNTVVAEFLNNQYNESNASKEIKKMSYINDA